MTRLPVLDARIDERVRATRDANPWWPCARGCDHCCRSLPRLPEITEAEWARLAAAVAQLGRSTSVEVVERVRRAASDEAPLVCPLLDRERGACLVYEARPIACRTYGFYTERDGSLCCSKVTEAVRANASDPEGVVWGNGEAVKHDMRELGLVRSLADWLDIRPPGK
ncbi:MAG: YkgJ family cysteine cluster protein [Labilithrix sp.]|nr:YkgJ family cysteine cluster protein [Labilithrix sp.]